MYADTYARLARLLVEETAIGADTLHPNTRLVRDVGMDGDDAAEFLDAFWAAFEVDPAGFRFNDYFENEGWFPLFGSRPRRKADITLDHLVKVARRGRWFPPGR